MSSSQPLVQAIPVVPPITPLELAVKNALSHPRLGTFEAATTVQPKVRGALELYSWNAQVSAALFAPLHICEVTIRNAVSDAVTQVYGHDWPWNPAFIGSLPDTGKWKMRTYLKKLGTKMPKASTTTGKIIPEINFVFWEKMFTGRFDAQIWNPHLFAVMPNINTALTVQQARSKINQDILSLRFLRNRIAHHEPVLNMSLINELNTIQELISFRCPDTAAWMLNNQQATALIAARPL